MITVFKKLGDSVVKSCIYDRDLDAMKTEGWLGTEQEALDSVIEENKNLDGPEPEPEPDGGNDQEKPRRGRPAKTAEVVADGGND